MLWRFRERLEMTVVLKAVFAIVPSGVATFVRPGTIHHDDQPFGGVPGRSVQFASDLVPYRARCDVTFVGHAYSPQVRAETVMPIRLAVVRDSQSLLDKSLRVLGPRKGAGGTPEPFWRMALSYEHARGAVGQLNPVGNDSPNVIDPIEPARPGGYGPISPSWPARASLIKGVPHGAFEGAIWSLPDPTPWDYFQSAPADQQIEPLKGGELLVLEGLHPTIRELVTRLPREHAVARAIIARPGEAMVEREVPMVCDGLAVDGDSQHFSLTWRGHFEVIGGEPALRFIGIAAELAPDRQAPAADGVKREGQPAPAEPAGSGTVRHEPVDRVRAALLPAVPFEYRPPRAGQSNRDATPWGGRPLEPAPPPIPGEATVVADERTEVQRVLPAPPPVQEEARPVPPEPARAPMAPAMRSEPAVLLADIAGSSGVERLHDLTIHPDEVGRLLAAVHNRTAPGKLKG